MAEILSNEPLLAKLLGYDALNFTSDINGVSKGDPFYKEYYTIVNYNRIAFVNQDEKCTEYGKKV